MPIHTLDVKYCEIQSRQDDSSEQNFAPITKIGLITAADLARELDADPSKIRLYISQLRNMGHPSFRNRKKRSPLTSEQANVVRDMRSLRLRKVVGDQLITILFRKAKLYRRQLEQLEQYCEEIGIAPQQTKELIPFVRTLIQSTFQ